MGEIKRGEIVKTEWEGWGREMRKWGNRRKRERWKFVSDIECEWGNLEQKLEKIETYMKKEVSDIEENNK